ncbi:PP0621 family protein [Thiomicrorhabdus sp.]|uniref:PP0621 family protein n=1 Tax=Thiomicrorhabdus sp. TaxID=2039724 RepID=UPI0029C75E5C|nr:PP0621 family protein [Thiomicrorhabdus sp.]
MRTLLLLALVIVLFILVRFTMNRIIEIRNRRLEEEEPVVSAEEKIVACHHCGLRIPESEALFDGQNHYCSQEHLEAGQRENH